MVGTGSIISPFKGLDIPLWRGCHCFQWSLVKAHKIKTWKTKREEFTWGRVLLSCDYHGILRPSFLIRESIRTVFTMQFQVLKRSRQSQGKDEGENPCWTWGTQQQCFSRAPAKGAYCPGQGLLLPMRNGGGKQSKARGKRNRVQSMLQLGKSPLTQTSNL